MIDKDNKTFCIFPWIHQHVTTSGDVLPCCTANYKTPLGNINNNTIEEIWNNENYRQLRYNMLNGIRSPHCETCYKHEGNSDPDTINSYRKNANKEFKEYLNFVKETKEDGYLESLNLRYFDVRWSNICNFKCRSCNDGFSSSIAQEISNTLEKDNPLYQVYRKASHNNENLLDQFKPYLKDMKILYFAGGEPLITDEHYKILDYLIDNNVHDIILRYNSNCSNLNYKKKSILDYWKNFKKIELMASIDSWGTRAEYIRNGTNWEQIVNNLKKIKEECPHVSITINSVVGLFNCLTVTDFLEELENQGLINIWHTSVFFYKQLYPTWQDFSIIPLEIRNQAIKKIDNYITNKFSCSTQSIIYTNLCILKGQLEQSVTEVDYNMVREEIQRLDLLRNENFVKTFPELSYIFS